MAVVRRPCVLFWQDTNLDADGGISRTTSLTWSCALLLLCRRRLQSSLRPPAQLGCRAHLGYLMQGRQVGQRALQPTV